jgi:hypothetical protein
MNHPRSAFGCLQGTPADRHNKPRSGAVAAEAHVREADVKARSAGRSQSRIRGVCLAASVHALRVVLRRHED